MNKATVLRLALTGGLGVTACAQVPDKPELKDHVTANSAAAVHTHTNRLAREKSPYLLQHQHNPVDWYAWGDEAFGKARQENKPLFLSIGYSTCHWCHVMERESFESEEVAKFLNEHFVSIKVDREERPDVDKIYMTFVQATTGSGGCAPKFPQPSQPQFLLRCARRFKDEEATRMVLHTCERMAAGGIRDQLGGGFARYSVDAEWLVPHFEKMLYDNAQLAQLYLDAYLLSGDSHHAEIARDILNYVLRDMTHPEGGFYSAEDADSEGHEGKFYCWTREEVSKLLTSEEFKVAVRYFGITESGNFVDHSHPSPLANQNVLSIVDPKLSEAEQPLLASAKKKMVDLRVKRVRPHLDDKVLASWNGLMLGAMA